MTTIPYTTNNQYFENLPCSCNDISSFHWAGRSLVVLCLKNREILRFYPDNVDNFLHWLHDRNIRQVA